MRGKPAIGNDQLCIVKSQRTRGGYGIFRFGQRHFGSVVVFNGYKHFSKRVAVGKQTAFTEDKALGLVSDVEYADLMYGNDGFLIAEIAYAHLRARGHDLRCGNGDVVCNIAFLAVYVFGFNGKTLGGKCISVIVVAFYGRSDHKGFKSVYCEA